MVWHAFTHQFFHHNATVSLQQYYFSTKMFDTLKAVSYTHLTLPTNREV